MGLKTCETRPLIALNHEDQVTHNGDLCRVVLRRGKISVGCSDITADALRHLLKRYDHHFGNDVVVIQDPKPKG
jgi:hypothetical protein